MLLGNDVTAAQQAVVAIAGRGNVMLDDRLARSLTSAISQHGAPVADVLVKNIGAFTVPFSSEYAARHLAEMLVDYASDSSAALWLLSWMPKLCRSQAIQQKLQIKNEGDLIMFEQAMRKLFSTPQMIALDVQDFMASAVRANPKALGIFLKVAAETAGRVSVSQIVDYLVDQRIGLDVLASHADLLGKITKGTPSVARRLTAAFPEQPEVLFAFIKGSGGGLDVFGDVLEQQIQQIPQVSLGVFVRALDGLSPKEYWPRKVVTALLCRNDIDPRSYISSAEFPSLYRNIVHHFSVSVAGVQADAFDPVKVLTALMDDPAFVQLDAKAIAELAREIGNLKRQEDLAPVKIVLLERLDWQSTMYFSERFFVGIPEQRLSEDHAIHMLERMRVMGRYPFTDVGYLIALACSLTPQRRNAFLLRDMSRLLTTLADREQLLLGLAQRLPEGFAYFYAKKKKQVLGSSNFQSDRQKEIYRLCWTSLGLWEQLKVMILPF